MLNICIVGVQLPQQLMYCSYWQYILSWCLHIVLLVWWQRVGFLYPPVAEETWPRGVCQPEADHIQVWGQEQFQDSQLSHLKSSVDGVCQPEASPGMSVLARSQTLEVGSRRSSSLIKNACVTISRTFPPSRQKFGNPGMYGDVRTSVCSMKTTKKALQHSTSCM